MKQFMTHQKKIQNKLLLENAQEIIIFFDSKGRIIDCSSKTIDELGYGEDIFHIPIYNIFKNVFEYEEKKLKIDLKYQNSLKETTAYRKNQTCFPVKLKITVLDKKNKFVGICTATNVSEKREAVLEINNLKSDLNNFSQISSELVARIAHELRTPINGIMGFSNNLLDMELESSQIEAVNIIKRCCNNMNTIINDLLDFAKIANNKLTIEQREFNFYSFIQDILNLNIVTINEKGLNLLLDISKDIPEKVIGDEHRLAQVLNNLFSNAIKFTQVGEISLEIVKVYQTERFVELFFMVIDTGIGIGREDKDKLFKSFSQVDSSITRRFGGTGLGLSICKKLVEAMNGNIEVESEINKGSTFSFSVRLGLPQKFSKSSSFAEKKDFQFNADDYKDTKEENIKDNTDISDLDYINSMLKEIIPREIENSIDVMQKALNEINSLVEKLIICIEMENWEKSEELANRIKNLIPKDHHTNAKNVLRLLLAIRKENHDVSLAVLNEFKACMLKEK